MIESTKEFFPKTLKLYHFTHRKLLSLSIKTSGEHVMTFFIKEDQFYRMRSEYQNDEGYKDSNFLVLQRHDCVRFTFFINDMSQHNLRIATDKWQALIKNHHELFDVSTKDLITCEVD